MVGAVEETSALRGEPMGGQLAQGNKFDVIW
jgi:hypothetical protein